MKRVPLYLCVLFAVVAFCSCKREERTTWNSGVLVPLAYGTMRLEDLVPDSLLTADENSLWHLKLVEDLTDFDLDSLVKIPDTTISRRFVVPIIGGPFPIPAGQVIINEEENNLLNLHGIELREIHVRSGYLEYSIRSYINGYLDCTYDLPGVTQDGIGTIIHTVTEPSVGTQPYIFNGSIDLSGHHINLTGETGTLFNRIFTHLTIQPATGAPSQTLVSGMDSVVVELKFIDPVIEYARGYFGQHEYHLDQNVNFSDQINFPQGALNLDQTFMRFHISNSVGTDARIQFTTLSNYNSAHNSSVALNYPQLYQPLNITRAFDNGSEVIPTLYDFTIDQDNSNILSFIENLPDAFQLQGDVSINPLGDVSDGHDFIYADNALHASLELDIPLLVAVDHMRFVDTLAIASSIDVTADGFLYLYAKNYFPFDAYCNVYLIDASNNHVIPMIDGGHVASALNGNSIGQTIPIQSVIRIPLNEDILREFNPENRIVIEFILDSPEFDQPAGIYRNYTIDYKIVGDADIELGYE